MPVKTEMAAGRLTAFQKIDNLIVHSEGDYDENDIRKTKIFCSYFNDMLDNFNDTSHEF